MVIRLPSDGRREIDLGAEPVSAGYLEALGGRLLEGRFFDERDVAGAPLVAILNHAAARAFFGNGAVGKSIENDRRRLEVVGVLADVRRTALEADPEPAVYLPNLQTASFRANNMLIRAQGDPRLLLPSVRTMLRHLDPDQALVRVATLQEGIDAATAPRRFVLQLVGAFSAMALLLAIIGVYAVVAESVARRVPEIGIRMALGATARNVTSMILRQGVWLLGLGTILGVGAALALRGVMSAVVFRVPTADPATYMVACLCLTSTTLVACLVPALRASRVDPVRALRQE